MSELIKKDDYISVMLSELDTVSTIEGIFKKTDNMEDRFLRCKNFRQWWHGTAYLKLTSNKEKKEYRERYGLKTQNLTDWSKPICNIKNNLDILKLAQDHKLNFAHTQAIGPIAESHPEKAEELLEKAIKGTTNKSGEYKPIAASVIKGQVTRLIAEDKEPEPEPTVWEVCQSEAHKMQELLIKVRKCTTNIAGSLESDPTIKKKLADMGLAESFVFCAQILAETAHTIDMAKSKTLLEENND